MQLNLFTQKTGKLYEKKAIDSQMITDFYKE